MKVTMIAAITVDGFIGRTEHHPSGSWTSPEDKQWFNEFIKQAGTIVMGSHTYASFGHSLMGVDTYVYSHKPQQFQNIEGVEVTSEDPRLLISRLQQAGRGQLVVCGGASIYRIFIAAGVVDELYITVEPLVFGNGIPLFDNEVEAKLLLLDSRLLNDSTQLLHYAIQNNLRP